MISASCSGNDVTVRWQSVAGVNYFLEPSANLATVPAVTALATNLPGPLGTTTYTNPGAGAAPLLFYRVGVGN